MSRRALLKAGAGVGLAIPFGGLLAACGSSGGGGETPILNSFFTLNNVYYHTYNESSRSAMRKFDMSYHVAVSNEDQSAQRSALEAAGAQGIKGVTMISSSEAIEPQLMRILNTEKIYVCNMWNNAPWSVPSEIGPYYTTYGVVNGPKTFEAVAEILFEKMGGKGKVIQLNGILGVSIDTERLAGVDAAAKKFPEIDIVTTRPGGWSRTVAQPVIQDLLVQYPDVEGIICHNDDMAIAVIAALRQKGLNKKVIVVSGDGVPEALKLMQSGDLYATLATHPGWLGGHFVSRLYDALNGWEPKPAERMIHWGCFVLDTPEAAKEYEKVMYKGTFPYDWKKMSHTLNPDSWEPGNLVVPFDPASYWAHRENEKPDGYELPEEYDEPHWKQEMEEVAKEWKDHFTNDPLTPVRDLCTKKGAEIIV
ncbi:MAG: substrate-binding domain-containing protein [Solirubrobacterales bacterium]